MSRTVSALVTWDDAYLGAIGPVAVGVPWWVEVEPVVACLHKALGVPVFVLRLLTVESGEGARDGHVTYHVAALERPAAGLLSPRPVDLAALIGPQERRMPWARVEGIREALTWAEDTLRVAGRPPTGPAGQDRTWNLAALFRLPTAQGPAWLKMTPSFATDEASVIAAFARVDPTLVPQVIGAVPRRVLLDHLPGEDCWIRAWTARRPGCDPARALSVAEPLAHLAYAVRYQEFLDGIEPSERIYHQGDPAASIRAALKAR